MSNENDSRSRLEQHYGKIEEAAARRKQIDDAYAIRQFNYKIDLVHTLTPVLFRGFVANPPGDYIRIATSSSKQKEIAWIIAKGFRWTKIVLFDGKLYNMSDTSDTLSMQNPMVYKTVNNAEELKSASNKYFLDLVVRGLIGNLFHHGIPYDQDRWSADYFPDNPEDKAHYVPKKPEPPKPFKESKKAKFKRIFNDWW